MVGYLSSRLGWLTALLMVGIFLLDLSLPRGLAVPICYVAVILLYSTFNQPRLVVAATVVCSVLLIFGYLASPAAPDLEFWKVLANRALAFIAIVITAQLSLYRLRGLKDLQAMATELQEIEAKSRGIEETARDGIITFDAQGRIFSVNTSAERMFGCDAKEMVGEAVTKLIPDIEGQETLEDQIAKLQNPNPNENTCRWEALGEYRIGGNFPLDITLSEVMLKRRRMFTAILRDLSELRKTEMAIRVSETNFRRMFQESPIGLVLCEMDGQVVQGNQTFLELVGYSHEEVADMNFWDFVVDEDQDQEKSPWFSAVIEDQDAHEMEITGKGETRLPVLLNGVTVESLDGHDQIWFTVEDHTRLKAAQQKLVRLSLYDDLTGLANRNLFKSSLVETIERVKRNRQVFALLYLDLDGFKSVNDTQGHDVGDVLLKRVAKRLTGALRRSDFIARLGGDEFAIVLEGLEQVGMCATVAQKIIDSLQATFNIDDKEIFVGASVGISVFPDNAQDASGLSKTADLAMYKAKELGGNRYQFYSEAIHTEVSRRVALENGLRHALEYDEFRLHFQPQVSLQTGRIVAVESLIRWQHPQQGLLPPSVFVPLLERSGMIADVGEWVLKTACTQLRQWQDQVDSSIRVAVNLSTRQLADPKLPQSVQRVLNDTAIDASSLEFEVTESVLMQNEERGIDILNTLHDQGVRVSIDDFGTGYSSLLYLKLLPIQALKIDRSFVADLSDNADDMAIVKATIALAKSLGLQVTAEGVENREQSLFLKRHQCNLAQGYYFGRPVAAEHITVLLQQQEQHLAIS